MIIKIEENKCVQKCVCGKLSGHKYSELKIINSYITMPPCQECGSLEILKNNNGNDEHSILITKVFANIAIQK